MILTQLWPSVWTMSLTPATPCGSEPSLGKVWSEGVIYLLLSVNVCVCRLGLAYAGSWRADVMDVITPVLWDSASSFEVRLQRLLESFLKFHWLDYWRLLIFLQVVCLGALSCATIFVGSCHGDLTESILQIMMERDASDLGKTHARYLALGLALLYLGKQESVDATVEALKVVTEPLCTFASTLLEICAYAGQLF